MANDETLSIREAVGVFSAASDMESAIEELEESGFDRAEISLLAGEETVRQKLGHIYSDARSLEDDPDVPRAAFVSTESIGDAEGALLGGLFYVGALAAAGAVVASGGAFGTVLVAAAAGGGSAGLIGGLLARIVGKHHSEHLQHQLERGGLLVWVRTRDEAHELKAVEILRRNKAADVHLHSVAAAS
ncbi:hypothetical protein [Aestuariivirga sp.]|uniref:hypothetical protein n=1 Tax=Aestuariivirga sp. TaxID=2650926 RepID=UPI0035938CBC